MKSTKIDNNINFGAIGAAQCRPKTLISGMFLYPQKVGGAEQYFNNLLEGFSKIDASDNIDLILNRACEGLYANYEAEFNVKYIPVKYNRAVYDYLLHFLAARKTDYDIIFSPNYITPFHLFKKKKYVTTILDLQYLHYPQFFSKLKRKFQYFSHLYTLNTADAVVCISDFVKEDIVRFFGEKFRKKLNVIHIPVNFDKLNSGISAESITHGAPFILSVAAHYPHKNLLTLVEAFNRLTNVLPEVKLILVGQLSCNLVGGDYGAYGKQLQAEVVKNRNIVVTGYIPDETLASLYQQCRLFVFPSLFEGFGMPPAEAMALGKPVITTRCGSLEEVTIKSATYINDPLDAEELSSLIRQCYQNGAMRKEDLYSIGKAVRKKYAPERIAEEYLQLFEKLKEK